MAAYDPDQIRRDNALSDVMEKRGFRLEKNGKEWLTACPFHNEKTPSFTIFPSKNGGQKGHCFGCGWTGDVIDFVSEFDNVGFRDACAILGGEATGRQWDGSRPEGAAGAGHDPYAGWVVGRPPSGAPLLEPGKRTVELWNPKRLDEHGKPKRIRYTPSMVFPYRDARGNLLAYVLRVDVEAGKKITPLLMWMTGPNGEKGWTHGAMPEPRPIYGLDQLAANPDWQVWVVEGEKAKDRVAQLAQGLPVVVVAWQGGGKAAAKTNWRVLKGRRVVLWGDADEPGEKTMLGWRGTRGEFHPGIAHMAMLVGAAEVKVVPWDKDKDEGWDGADAADGWTDKRTGEVFAPWTQKDVLAWIKSRVFVWTPDPAEMAEVDAEAFTRPFVEREPVEAAPSHDEPPPASPEDYGQGFEPDYEPAPPPNGRSREAKQTQQEAPEPERKPSNVVNLKGEPVDDTDWRTGLVYSSGDDPKLKPKALQNIMLFVQHHKQLAGVFAYDDFAKQVVLLRRPPWWPAGDAWEPRALQDEDLVRCTGFLETLHLTPKVTDTTNAIIAAATAEKFNPVQDHLLGLKWDGIPRLTGGMVEGESIGCWLAEYLGAEDTDVNRAFSLRWMISAAARALRPGCKCDTMLILEGEQGAMKSTALRVLGTFGGKCYYTDEVGELNSKDAAMQLQGVVIVEIGELNALGRAEANAIKAWLARQVDRFRPPFGKAVRDFPRQCVLAGTMNPVGNGYLKDETGGRRFFPVLVTDVDLDGLRRDADQLWAEAVHRFHAGEQWWLTPEEAVMAGKVVAERYEEDAWADAIDSFLECRVQVRLQEIMEECLSIPKERQNQMVEKRIAKHLRHRKWLRQKVHVKLMGKPKWVYVSPDT